MRAQATKSTGLLTNELLVQSIQSVGTNKNMLLDEQSSKQFNIEGTQVYFSKQHNQRVLQQRPMYVGGGKYSLRKDFGPKAKK